MKPLIIKKSKFEKPPTDDKISDPLDDRRIYGKGLPEEGVLVKDLPQEVQDNIKQEMKAQDGLPVEEIGEIARLKADTYNTATRGKHFTNEIRFSAYNHHTLINGMGYRYNKKAKTYVKYTDTPRIIDMAVAPKHTNQPILIIGSGPTFDDMATLLKDWEGDIMASTSQAATCCYLGKEPTYIMALDPNSFIDEMKVDTWEGRKSILILHPGVTPNLVEEWKGPMYLFRKLQPQTPFYDNEQKIAYSALGEKNINVDGKTGNTWGFDSDIFIKSQIPMLACVLSAQICAAKQLGYGRQYLIGADLGMPNNKARFTSWSYDKNEWKESKSSLDEFLKFTTARGNQDPIFKAQNGTPTTAMFVFYAHQIVTAWRITEADIVSASDKGIISIFPTTTAAEIIRKQGQGIKGYNKKRICWETEKYLAKQNIYFLYVGSGIMPHEFKDPLHDIPRMLNEVEKALAQQGKQAMLDKDANMRRITKLFNAIAKGK